MPGCASSGSFARPSIIACSGALVLSTLASMIILSTGLFGFSVYPSPPVCVINSRIVNERRASSSFGVPSSFRPA